MQAERPQTLPIRPEVIGADEPAMLDGLRPLARLLLRLSRLTEAKNTDQAGERLQASAQTTVD